MGKNTATLEIVCHTGAAIGSAVSNPVHTFLNALQVLRLSMPSKMVTLVTCSIAAVVLGFESRFLGTLGYLSIASEWKQLAAALLAFHYGLMSFDAQDENVLSSASYAGLAAAYCIENFPQDKHE